MKAAPSSATSSLERVSLIAEPSAELPIEPSLCTSPMRVLVGKHAVIGRRVAELLELRHLNKIAGWRVERPVATMPNISVARCEEPLGSLDPLRLVEIFNALLAAADLARIEPINLCRVEHEIAARD